MRMQDQPRPQRRASRPSTGAHAGRHARAAMMMPAVLVMCILLATANAAAAGTARACLEVAIHAADAWADDAQLVWVENDASLDPGGRAEAWGFLFYAPSLHAMRSYSVRNGALVQAQDQKVSIAAPVLGTWVDSDVPTQQAWRRAVETWGEAVRLESLLLVRGVFAPDTAWVAVFARDAGVRLFVVCDAETGQVLRAWRG